MELSECFKNYCESIQITPKEREKWDNRLNSICKKLNKRYYGINSGTENIILVGSVGRGTATKCVSDWDCIFPLPDSVYKKFNAYQNNGQSALLQEVKDVIKELYPKTKIKGDGQVVVIEYSDGGIIELVPAFKQFDGSYKYPNSNRGGSWKITNPVPEIDSAINTSNETGKHYKYLCQLLRKWKDANGFKFKGLLIDTLVKKFIDDKLDNVNINFKDYETIIKDLFKYLSEQDPNRIFWFSLGSNQKITNDDSGRFIKKASKVYFLLQDANDEKKFKEICIGLFGNDFVGEEASTRRAKNENFIEEMFLVDIRYNIQLDCNITQDGFRPSKLRTFLSNKWKLKNNKQLDFYIVENDIPEKMKDKVVWHWKVRNTGDEAKNRNMERGEIREGNMKWREVASFSGNHYVECYAVLTNVVVARARIEVPIDTIRGYNLFV